MAHFGKRWLVMLLLSGVSAAQPAPTRVIPTDAVAHETGDARLPRFSPDSRTLAYAVDLTSHQPPLSEIRVIGLADGRRRTLLHRREAQGVAAYSAYALGLKWLDSDHLAADLSDGDVGYTEFRLDRRRTGSLTESYVDLYGYGEISPAEDTVVAILPDWKRAALDAAVANALKVEGRGMLLQKSFAGEDRHVWWLDTQEATARILVPEVAGEHAELRGGFAFAGRLLFALRQGTAVRVFQLDEGGQLTRVPGAGSEAIPGGVLAWPARSPPASDRLKSDAAVRRPAGPGCTSATTTGFRCRCCAWIGTARWRSLAVSRGWRISTCHTICAISPPRRCKATAGHWFCTG